MLDFSKLNDPETTARIRAEMDEKAAAMEALDKELQGLIDQALGNEASLSDKERRFLNSCRFALNSFRPLSEAQIKWLRDICRRFASAN